MKSEGERERNFSGGDLVNSQITYYRGKIVAKYIFPNKIFFLIKDKIRQNDTLLNWQIHFIRFWRIAFSNFGENSFMLMLKTGEFLHKQAWFKLIHQFLQIY